MAAPLDVQAPTPGNLVNWSLPGDSPVSQLLSYNTDVMVYYRNVVQYAGEPVTLHFGVPGSTISYTKVAVDDWVGVPQTTNKSCTSDTDPACNTTPPADPPDVNVSGTVPAANMFWRVKIVDATNGTVLVDEFSDPTATLPARTTGEAPHPYYVEVSLAVTTTLNPPVSSTGSLGEYGLLGLTYTGFPPIPGETKCASAPRSKLTPTGATIWFCSAVQYNEIKALDHLVLNFAASNDTLVTAPGGGVFENAAYAASALHVPAMTWNSGDDDLPGPK